MRRLPFFLGLLCGAMHVVLTLEGFHLQAWLLEILVGLLGKIMENDRWVLRR